MVDPANSDPNRRRAAFGELIFRIFDRLKFQPALGRCKISRFLTGYEIFRLGRAEHEV